MARTRQLLRSITGRGGTPPTSSRASAGGLPRNQSKTLRCTWQIPADEGRHRLRYALSDCALSQRPRQALGAGGAGCCRGHRGCGGEGPLLSRVPRKASDFGVDRLLQAFEPKRHVAQNSVDKERRSRSHAAAGPTLDMLLYTLQVHVIIYLEVVALEIELSFLRKFVEDFSP